ncbi:SpoIIE family protein phosphatase [Actinokineospora pegani]|uniref:SpoIIE family protein phosphatase n=1 Tax=Actinokineospora pegani TaxID=2654637 RepID=UPI0012EA694B|nr:SpoIIE family protein phosphatase [Actinokineospora pegani]
MAVEHEGGRVFTGPDAAAALMAAVDWPSTPLGDVAGWPAQLRSVVRTMLSSKQQMVLFWGPRRIALYNDSYAPTIGDKHPGALGRPAEENWGELWGVLAPLLDRVQGSGEPFRAEDHPFPIVRRGFLEQTYFTISYDPVLVDEPGSGGTRVGGVLCLVTETTARVLGERRMRALGLLGTRLSGLDTAERVGRAAATAVSEFPEDLPSALVYLCDEERRDTLRLLGAVRRGALPTAVELTRPDPAVQVLATVLADGEAAWLPDRAGEPRSLAMPLTTPTGTVGVLVAGVNPMLAVDEGYRDFLDLFAAGVSSALGNAAAHDAERRRTSALAELDRAKTELFANISHELRTPLTLIAGPAEDALTDRVEPLAGAQRERVELIRRNATRLSRMVDNLLDFTRIESGALRPERVATDLAEFTRAITDSFRPAIERAGLELVLDAPPLPRPVSVDRDMWQRVMLNLLSNALKFTLAGRVEVRVADGDGQARVSVTDTGLGIPAEDVPRLFERFHRVRGAAGRSREGTGIGLALAAELVALHDGHIGVDSEPGRGSSFTIVLPYGQSPATSEVPPRGVAAEAYLDEAMGWGEGRGWQESDDEPPALRGDTHAAGSDPRGTAGARVLVVEDNADLRGFLVRLLGKHWEATAVADGEQALAVVRRSRPDLVISDVVMPGVDGFTLLDRLRGDPATAHIPVVLLSARAGEEAAIEGLARGADDYLSKPFSAQELLARVRSNLEMARLRTQQAAWRAALVEALDDGFFMMDGDGAILEMNAAFAQTLGIDPADVPVTRPYPWVPPHPDTGEKLETLLSEGLTDGGGRFLVPAVRPSGRRLWLSVSLNEVAVPGVAKRFVGTMRDVTADRVAAERDAAQATFAGRLADAADVGAVLEAGTAGLGAAWSTGPAVVAAWVTEPDEAGVEERDVPTVLRDPSGRTWEGLPGAARRALEGARHTRGTRVVAEDGGGRSVGIATRLDIAGEPTAVWLGLDPPQVVTDVDRYLFSSLCALLGQALTRARAFDEQRTVAVTLQRSILGPTSLPSGFAVRYEPAVEPLEVGGDWYDVVRLDAHRVGVVVGDCVGRGLRAASVMGQLRSACRALLRQAIGPAQVLTTLDDFAEMLPGAVCTTVFCAIVDRGAGTLEYSSAGHLPGLVVGGDGDGALLDGANSVPLGVAPGMPRPQARVELAEGCLVLLYTDGLVERRGEVIDEGIGRALRVLGQAAAEPGLDAVLDRVITGLVTPHDHDDDIAALIYRHTGDQA